MKINLLFLGLQVVEENKNGIVVGKVIVEICQKFRNGRLSKILPAKIWLPHPPVFQEVSDSRFDDLDRLGLAPTNFSISAAPGFSWSRTVSQ